MLSTISAASCDYCRSTAFAVAHSGTSEPKLHQPAGDLPFGFYLATRTTSATDKMSLTDTWVSDTIIIFNDHSFWDPWIQIIKDRAKATGVWHFIDTNGPAQPDLTPLVEPSNIDEPLKTMLDEGRSILKLEDQSHQYEI